MKTPTLSDHTSCHQVSYRTVSERVTVKKTE